MKEKTSLTEGHVLGTLLKFTIPILLSILLQTTYGTADLLIVSQFSAVGDTSGVTIGSQVMQTLTNFFIGLSMGATILIGRYIGSNQKERAGRVVGVNIVLMTVLAVVATGAIVWSIPAIVTAMQTPAEAVEATEAYLRICGLGTVFIVFYNLLGSVFRGIGDSKTPLWTVLMACIINIALDLLLVGVFKMGAEGAAWATVVAQASSVMLSMLLIRRQTLPFAFGKKDMVFDGAYIKDTLKLGIPVALQSVLVAGSFLVLTAIINVFGVYASAAVGIVTKITGIILVVPQAFMQSMSAFTAQNLGAGKEERAKKALWQGIVVSLLLGVGMGYVAAFHGTVFTSIFMPDPETTVFALQYLKSYAIDCVLVAVFFSMAGYFSGCGHTTFVMFQAVFGSFCIRIPVAYWISTWEHTSMFLIGLATPASSIIQIVLCLWFYFHWMKRKKVAKIA